MPDDQKKEREWCQMTITLDDIFEIDELGRRVVHEAVEKISLGVRKDIVIEAKKRIGVEIDTQITAVVAEAVEKKRQATNWMGEAKGEVTTLAEEILKRSEKMLEMSVDKESGKEANYHAAGKIPFMQYLMRKTLDSALRAHIEEAAHKVGIQVAKHFPTANIIEQMKAIVVLPEEDADE